MKKNISDEIYDKLDYAKSIVAVFPDKSMGICMEVYDLAKASNLLIEEGYALIGIVLCSRIKSDSSSMLDNSYKALDIFIDQGHIPGQIRALNLIGIAYFYSSVYDEALRSFLKVIDLLELYRDDYLLSSVLNNIGEIYRESEVYEKAIEYYERAIDISIANDYSMNYASILGNMGEVYYNKKDFREALNSYNRSYEILIDEENDINLGEIENRIGRIYYEMNDLIKAEEYYLKSYEKLEGINNKYYVIDVLINLGELYMKNGREKTLHYYERAIDFAEEVGAKKKLYQVYKLVSKYYEDKEDYRYSLEYYKKCAEINQEIVSSSIRTRLEILNIEFRYVHDMDKFEQIRGRLENEITRQKRKLEKIEIENKMLEKKAYEDELTGILNRRGINIYLNKMIENMFLNKEPLVLFMIDIDYFKKYNDCWGHSQGDMCLIKISEAIKRIQIDRNDTFGRYGGEEFLYISKNISYEKALKLGNLIRTEIEKMGLYYLDNGEKRTVTISLGGVRGANFKSLSDIMELADGQLYKAKSMGRNITLLKEI